MFRRSQILRDIDRRTEKIETILMLRDPGATMAADAYDGLRRAVLGAREARQAHLVHLARLDSEMDRGEHPDDLTKLLRDLCAQAGLQRIQDPSLAPECFDIDGEGEKFEVIEPAYVDTANSTLVREGRARAIPDQATQAADSTAIEPAPVEGSAPDPEVRS